MKLISLLFFFTICVASLEAWSAACCGGNFASPALISGDEKHTLTMAWSESQIASYADRHGQVLTQNGISERSLQLSGATILSDRWQLGALTSIKQQTRTDQDVQSTAMGDSSLLLGYEALPEWTYNPYLPHGFAYMQLTAPTGVSTYESSKTANVDVTGSGFWTFGTGLLLTKNWLPWDAQLQLEVHQGLPRSFNNTTYGHMRAKPQPGGSTFISGGYNLDDFRFGMGLRYTEDGPVNINGTSNSASQAKRWSSLILSANYLMAQEWALALTYSDDTLFGSPSNALLSKAVIFSLQRRWAR